MKTNWIKKIALYIAEQNSKEFCDPPPQLLHYIEATVFN